MEGTNRPMDKLKNNWASYLNTLVSVCTLGALIFYVGATWKTITNHEDRLIKLEAHGSVSLQKHESLDDERIDAIKDRVATVERATSALPIIQGDLRVIQGKLDALKEQLARHESMTEKKP